MNRRDATQILLAALAAGPLSVIVQERARVPLIGLPLISAGSEDVMVQALRNGLSARGLVDGKNIRVEYRGAQGSLDQLVQNIDELVRMQVDIFVAGNESIARAIQKATQGTTPIVVVAWDYDPVETGLIQSLAHPGGNITGVSTRSTELIGKRLELLRDLNPRLKRVAVLYDAFGENQLKYVDSPASLLGLELKRIAMHPQYDYAVALKSARSFGAGAVVVTFSPRFWLDRQRIAALALAQKLPSMSYESATVRKGGLISYGPNTADTWGRAAYFIDRILKGEKPSELPVEQPDRFTLAVNFKTARTLGMTIPESIMIRVNEAIN